MNARSVTDLGSLSEAQIPPELRYTAYFDFCAHPFEHQRLIEAASSVCEAVERLGAYAGQWLDETCRTRRPSAVEIGASELPHTVCRGEFQVYLEEGAVFEPRRIVGAESGGERHAVYVSQYAQVLGGTVALGAGSVFFGAGAVMEDSSSVRGPCIVGCGSKILQGAYLRENTVVGKDALIRGEIKNSILMDGACFPHPCYVGDSLCGYRSHFGNQATTANISIFAGLSDAGEEPPLTIRCGDRRFRLGGPKFGACLGDFCQVGCSAVTDPGVFMQPRTVVYPLTRVPGGVYGPDEILKNKPMEHGVIERCRRLASQEAPAGGSV